MTKRTERFLNGLVGALLAAGLIALLVLATGCAGRFITESEHVEPKPPKIVEVEIFSLWDRVALLAEEIGFLVTYQRVPSPALHDKALELLEFAGALRDGKQYEPRPHETDRYWMTIEAIMAKRRATFSKTAIDFSKREEDRGDWDDITDRADDALDELPEVTP